MQVFHRHSPMPDRFQELADYNGRVRGTVVTPEREAEMAALQAEFNEWRDAVVIPEINNCRRCHDGWFMRWILRH